MNFLSLNGNKTSQSSILQKQIEKKQFEYCFVSFKKNILQNFQLELLINKSLKCELDKLEIRGIVWRIFLNVLPGNTNIAQWVKQTEEKRDYYKKKKKEFRKLKNFEVDPLQGGNKNSWNTIQLDKELKKIIDLDIIRTYQEYNLFHHKKIQQMLFNVLFVWAKINEEVSYKQGMNEIIAVLLMVLYPYYIENPKLYSQLDNNLTSKEWIREITSAEEELHNIPEGLLREIYIYLNNETELEADLFSLFSEFMNRGIKDIYFVPDVEMYPDLNITDNEIKKKMELFHSKWIPSEIETIKKQNEEESFNKVLHKFPIHKRINKIYKEYLPLLDKEVYEYLNETNTEVSIFLQRWLRCLLIREFEFSKVVLLWDAIMAYDMDKINTKFNYKPSFIMLDYICTYLMHKSRNEILNKDLNIIYERYLHSAYNGKILDLINSALLVKEMFKSKEDQNIMKMSKSIKSKSQFGGSIKETDSNISPILRVKPIPIRSSKNNSISSNIELFMSEKTNKLKENETEVSLDVRLSLQSNLSNNSDNYTILNGQIKKLERIYLKYKSYFSLKDSRDILVILMKLKNKSKSNIK